MHVQNRSNARRHLGEKLITSFKVLDVKNPRFLKKRFRTMYEVQEYATGIDTFSFASELCMGPYRCMG